MSTSRKSSKASTTRDSTNTVPSVNIDVDQLEIVEEEQHHQPSQNEETEGGIEQIDDTEFKSLIFTKFFKKVHNEGIYFNVICNFCSKVYKFKKGGGYGTFKRHVESKHPTQIGLDRQQTQLTGCASSNPTNIFKFDNNTWRDELARCISVEHLPFNFGEKVNIINMCRKALNPATKPVSRNTIKRCIKNLYRQGKEDLTKLFYEHKGKFSICCDVWSDHWQTHSYMGVTCHWVDIENILQKRLIAYRIFDDSHSAQNISNIVYIILQEYNLVNKVFSISFDNASANTASISELEKICKPTFGGKFFHIRCVCHVLNLCVQDGLKFLDGTLNPIKNAINFIWSHNHVKKEWAKFCRENGKRPKKFPRDIPTRWNSTYRLLQDCFDYKDLLCGFLGTNYPRLYFSPQTWVTLEKILHLLSTFNTATERLSGVYYPTSHLIVHECINIALALNSLTDDAVLHSVSIVMKDKWKKYFLEIPPLNLVASVFDPRLKLDGLEEYLDIYYKNLNVNTNDSEEEEVDISMIIKTVKNYILELILENTSRVSSTEDRSSSSTSSSQTYKGKGILSPSEVLWKERIKRPKSSYNSSMELDLYLTSMFNYDEYESQPFDLLKWWKEHANQFPVLACISREILGCPVSTVAVEQAFSAGGNILTETRSVLSPESLEAQVCLDDWTKAELRSQQQAHLDDYGQFDLSSDGTTTGESDT